MITDDLRNKKLICVKGLMCVWSYNKINISLGISRIQKQGGLRKLDRRRKYKDCRLELTIS